MHLTLPISAECEKDELTSLGDPEDDSLDGGNDALSNAECVTENGSPIDLSNRTKFS